MADVQPHVKRLHDLQTPENGNEGRASGEGDGEGVGVTLDWASGRVRSDKGNRDLGRINVLQTKLAH
jgi:hypothetical protein